jgi:formate--tetrahydrofolate ligase
MATFPSDIEIAQSATMCHIKEIAKKINISEEDLEYYGKYKAKLPLYLQQENPKGKLIWFLLCRLPNMERVKQPCQLG